MYIKRNYGFWMTLNWSKWPFIIGLVYASTIFALAHFLDLRLAIPWQLRGMDPSSTYG